MRPCRSWNGNSRKQEPSRARTAVSLTPITVHCVRSTPTGFSCSTRTPRSSRVHSPISSTGSAHAQRWDLLESDNSIRTAKCFPTIRRFPNALRSLFEAFGSERFPFRASWLGERELNLEVYDRDVTCDWTSGSFMLIRWERSRAPVFLTSDSSFTAKRPTSASASGRRAGKFDTFRTSRSSIMQARQVSIRGWPRRMRSLGSCTAGSISLHCIAAPTSARLPSVTEPARLLPDGIARSRQDDAPSRAQRSPFC